MSSLIPNKVANYSSKELIGSRPRSEVRWCVEDRPLSLANVAIKAKDTVLGRSPLKLVLKFVKLEPPRETEAEVFHLAAPLFQIQDLGDRPNLVRVLSVYHREVPGCIGVLMDSAKGPPLSQTLDVGPEITLNQAISIVEGILAALMNVQEQGDFSLPHLNLKPSNIFVGRSTVEVGDFGFGELVSGPFSAAEQEGDWLTLSMSYKAPEQHDNRFGEPGPRSDLFSVGVIFYELLTGVNPFLSIRSDFPFESDLKPVSRVNGALPGAFDDLLRKALRKSQDERYQDATSFLQDLQSAQASVSATQLALLLPLKSVTDPWKSEEKSVAKLDAVDPPAPAVDTTAPSGNDNEEEGSDTPPPPPSKPETVPPVEPPQLPPWEWLERLWNNKRLKLILASLALVGIFIVAIPRGCTSKAPPESPSPSTPPVAKHITVRLTEPVGANVSLSGPKLRETWECDISQSVACEKSLEIGNYTVIVKHKQYQDWTQKFHLDANNISPMVIQPEKRLKLGMVEFIAVAPEKLQIREGDQEAIRLDANKPRIRLPIGHHKITVSRLGFSKQDIPVDVTADQSQRIELTLLPDLDLLTKEVKNLSSAGGEVSIDHNVDGKRILVIQKVNRITQSARASCAKIETRLNTLITPPLETKCDVQRKNLRIPTPRQQDLSRVIQNEIYSDQNFQNHRLFVHGLKVDVTGGIAKITGITTQETTKQFLCGLIKHYAEKHGLRPACRLL